MALVFPITKVDVDNAVRGNSVASLFDNHVQYNKEITRGALFPFLPLKYLILSTRIVVDVAITLQPLSMHRFPSNKVLQMSSSLKFCKTKTNIDK